MNQASEDNIPQPQTEPSPSRRTFIGTATGTVMVGSLAAAYGTLGAYAGRYLYPHKDQPKEWQFVAIVGEIKLGQSLQYVTTGGARIAIARQGDAGAVDDFIALSSVCPHLGCQVHWQGQKNRFFCPCHNGVFDPKGRGTGGPPGDAGQSLARYPLKIESGLLFIHVPTETLSAPA